MKNIPHPKVFTKDDHACVSLKDIIAHQLAYGMELDTITECLKNKSTYCIATSIAAQNIYEETKSQTGVPENTLNLYVIFWSDDFEVTNIKKRQSVWVHTITIFPPAEYSTSARYTHALSLGMKGVNHDSIIEMYHNELTELKTLHICTVERLNVQFLLWFAFLLLQQIGQNDVQ